MNGKEEAFDGGQGDDVNIDIGIGVDIENDIDIDNCMDSILWNCY